MARKTTSAFLVLVLMASLPVLAASRGDWPQFRGPEQDGIFLGDELISSRSFGLEIAWKRSLGSGYSSISLADGVGVVMFTEGDHDYLTAFDAASGKERWRYRLGDKYAGHDGSDDGPLSTPTLHKGVAFALSGKGKLVAVKVSDGSELWSHQLGETDSVKPFYGYTTAPVVADDLVILQTGGPNGHSVTAYDRKNGKVRWNVEDDSVTYQSPALLELGGKKQLVAIGDKNVFGLEPKTGKVLWKYLHTDQDSRGNSGQPIRLADNRLLLNRVNGESVALEVSGTEVKEVWRNNAFQRSHSVPVFHDGHLYGFSGRFMTCINAENGEVVWKSRPPGGFGLILVDGHLVVVGNNGLLSVSKASPQGFQQVASLNALSTASWTPPSFANGHIYVRDLKEMASIRIIDAPAGSGEAAEAMPELKGAFGGFLRGLEGSPNKVAAIERYLEAQDSLPIVEENGLVHFVFYGEAQDVALGGNVNGFQGAAVGLHRLPETNLFWRTLELDAKGHYEYHFDVDFGNLRTDSKNPHSLEAGQPTSELRMPGWRVPQHLAELAEGAPRGTLDSFQMWSEVLENYRRIRIYLPPGYGSGDDRYPLLLVNNGDGALDSSKMDRSLDHLIGQSVTPTVVAFLPRMRGEYGGPASGNYGRFIVEELIPHLEKHYRLQDEASSRGVMGVGSGGLISTYLAFKHPGVFGKLATQSFYLTAGVEDELFELIEQGERQDLDVFVEWSVNDYKTQNIDAQAASKRLVEALKAKGYSPRESEVHGVPGWGSWRANNDLILEAFFPADSEG